MRGRYSENFTIMVGGLTVLALLATVGLSYGSSARKSVKAGYPVEALFNRIDGLAPNAAVHLAGVRVGTVTGQSLQGDFRAKLTLLIDGGIQLPADTSAAIQTDSLFGDKLVVLEPGGDSEFIKPGGRITMTQDPLILEELLELIISQGKQRRAKAAEPATPASGDKG